MCDQTRKDRSIERLTLVNISDVSQPGVALKDDTFTCPSDQCKSLTVVIMKGLGAAQDKHSIIVVMPPDKKLTP